MLSKTRPRLKHTRMQTIKVSHGQENQEAPKRYQESRQTRILSTQDGQEARQSHRSRKDEDEGQMLRDLLIETYWSI